MQPWSLARLALGAAEHLSGTAIAELVRRASPVPLLERMPIAMACVAARRRDGVAMAFTAGDVGLAVQASAAIAGRFAPVRIRGEQYVDADWSTPLPVRVARALGAQRVLAVDATAHLDRAPPGAERYRESDLRKQSLVDADAKVADQVLNPTSATGSACRANSASAPWTPVTTRRWRRPMPCARCTRFEVPGQGPELRQTPVSHAARSG
jgi:NTE family protein